VACIPPELQNISIVSPSKKLEIISPALLLFTGYRMIYKIYGKGLIYPKKFILLKITI
jgi:hypothetical protein